MLFHRKSTGIARDDPVVLALLQQIHGHELRLKQVLERVEAMEAAHERLRGRFYATKGPEPAKQPESKAEILKAFGFMPGKPAPHK